MNGEIPGLFSKGGMAHFSRLLNCGLTSHVMHASPIKTDLLYTCRGWGDDRNKAMLDGLFTTLSHGHPSELFAQQGTCQRKQLWGQLTLPFHPHTALHFILQEGD